MSIVASLSTSSIQRLRKTWEGLSEESVASLHELELLMSTESNYSQYRKLARRLMGRVPSIPYLGLYLKDITFINDGNPKRVQNGQVNFLKNWLIYDLVRFLLCFALLCFLQFNTEILQPVWQLWKNRKFHLCLHPKT